MITVTKNGNSVLFEFTDSTQYLYGDGKIEVPVNSLSVIADESKMITLRKAASHDIFISAAYTDFGYSSKDEAVADLKDLLFGETGGGGITPEEVEEMIDTALTDVYDDIEVIDTALNELNEASEETASAITELNQAMDTMVAALNQVHGEINNVYTELHDKITENSDSITNLNSELDSVEGDVAALSDDIAALSGDVADVQANITDIQADIADIQANMGGLKLVKIYESDYEALSEKDGNTLYVVVEDPPYEGRYFTIKSLADNNTISFKAPNTGNTKTVSASTDGGTTWNAYTTTTGGTALATLNTGDTLLVKGENAQYNGNNFTSTGQFNVYGNIMSLLSGDNFSGVTALASSSTFVALFKNNYNLVSAENLVLPATTLAEYCYRDMFSGCTSLTTAPELPATTLAGSCYSSMFNGCTSITTAPELPATALVSWCYSSMFYGCRSLTTAPELPATTLTDDCYKEMFRNCTSLTTAPELPATTLTWECYYGMFQGCTSLTTAPELPATTLVYQCYRQMFDGCTSLNYIKMLATDISASSCLGTWVRNVSATGTFVKNASMSSLPTGTSGIPTGWTVQDA